MNKEPDKNVINELTNKLFDNITLIKILKTANAEKDALIEKQAIKLVVLSHKIAESDKILTEISAPPEISKVIGGCEDE